MRFQKILPIIGLAIFVVILSQLDISQIIVLFSDIHPLYATGSFFVFIPLLLLATIEWRLLLKRQRINVSFWYSIKNFFIGYFYGFITPGGIGAYTRSLYLSKESGKPVGKCLSNILTFNTIEFLALLFIGLTSAIFLSSVYPYLFFIILFIILSVLFLYVFLFRWNASKQLFEKIMKRIWFLKKIENFQESFYSFHRDLPTLKDVLIPFGLSIIGWFLKYSLLFLIAQLFSISISLYYFIFILAIADIIASIPISVYGIGTREASLITLFSIPQFTQGVIISSEQIVSLSLFWFVILWLIPSIIGSFVTLYETKRAHFVTNDDNEVMQFERYMNKYPQLYHQLARIVIEFTSNNHPVVLDIGVGPGLLSREIKNMIPHAEIIGIDPSRNMIKRAIKNSNIQCLIGSVEQIPLQNDSVDLVVSRFTLAYLKKPNQGFQEIKRILKPGCFFIVEGLNKDFSKLKLFFTKLHMIFNKSGWSVAQYHIDAYDTAYRIGSVINFFEKNGFKIVKKIYKIKDWKYIIIGKKY